MPKKKKVTKKDLNPVELIDRIPSQDFDLDNLADFLHQQIEGMEADRNDYLDRREQYLEIIDNFIDYDVGPLPFDGAANIHIPITMEKARATHARFYQAVTSVSPLFFVEPQEPIDAHRINNITNLMKWGLSRGVNYYKGINSVIDDSLWNFTTDGWCFLNLRYERKFRKALVTEEVKGNKKKGRAPKDGELTGEDVPVLFEEKEKWIPVYEGPVVDNIQNESVLMPGGVDIQFAPCIAIETEWTLHDLNYWAATEFFDSKAANKIKTFKDSEVIHKDSKKIKDQKGRLQGVKITDQKASKTDAEGLPDKFGGYICYCTFDIDGDGFDEELVVYYHRDSNTVARWTYLDRITSTLRRPIYKADYVRRPGRQYSIGVCELLFGLNREIDAAHNQRLDYGTISNMPFWFYQAGMAMPNQQIELAPGRGIPVEDTSQVLFPTLKSGTAWGFQEESLLFSIASKVSSISEINTGVVPSPGDAVRSQGQLDRLINEGNAPLDVSLRRYQDMLSEIYGDIHQMYKDKLPSDFKHMIVGDDGTNIADPKTGLPLSKKFKDPRKEIAGKVHFHLKANSAAGNRLLQFQNRIQMKQVLMDPISLQSGTISPLNIYEINRAILESSNEIDVDRFITKPENIVPPMELGKELEFLRQGIMPTIVLNDDHQAKAQAIQAWIQSDVVATGLASGTVNPNAPIFAEAAIAKHLQLAQAVAQQAQQAQGAVPQQQGQLALPAETGLPGGNNAGQTPSPENETSS